MAKAKVDLHGIGTKEVGYADSSYGPFNCAHCVWFQWSKKDGLCSHPEVIADPEVEKEKDKARVDPQGCCNEFRPTRKLDEVEFNKVGL